MLTMFFSFRVSEKSQDTSSLLWTSSAGCLWTSSEWFVVAACMRRNGPFLSSITLRVTVAWKIWASQTSQVRRDCKKLWVNNTWQWGICPEHWTWNVMQHTTAERETKLSKQFPASHWLWMIYIEITWITNASLDHSFLWSIYDLVKLPSQNKWMW